MVSYRKDTIGQEKIEARNKSEEALLGGFGLIVVVASIIDYNGHVAAGKVLLKLEQELCQSVQSESDYQRILTHLIDLKLIFFSEHIGLAEIEEFKSKILPGELDRLTSEQSSPLSATMQIFLINSQLLNASSKSKRITLLLSTSTIIRTSRSCARSTSQKAIRLPISSIARYSFLLNSRTNTYKNYSNRCNQLISKPNSDSMSAKLVNQFMGSKNEVWVGLLICDVLQSMRVVVGVLLLLLVVFVQSQRETHLYDLLQVTEKATSDELKKAFRRLSVKYHPDRNADKPDILKKYVEIKHAYEILIDVSKRITYDLHGEAGLKELEKNPLRKGGDFRTEQWVPLEKFYTGGEMVYSFRRGEICKHCKGTGESGGEKTPCPACQGSGKMFREVKVKDQVKKMEMKCKACGGSGIAASSKCPVCGGNKIIIAPRDLKYQLEKGMKNGDVVLFKGESEQGFDFYPGDVYVKLNQIEHPTFRREGNDLRVTLDISLKEAILGFERRLPHLDGHTVYIEESQGIQDGKVLQIENEGMPIRGEMDSYGKLLATINIASKRFSEQELSRIKQIFEAARQNQDL